MACTSVMDSVRGNLNRGLGSNWSQGVTSSLYAVEAKSQVGQSFTACCREEYSNSRSHHHKGMGFPSLYFVARQALALALSTLLDAQYLFSLMKRSCVKSLHRSDSGNFI